MSEYKRIIPKGLRNDLFVTHKNIGQSIKYFSKVLNAMDAKNGDAIAVRTALHGLLNTIIMEEDKRDNTD